MQTLLQTVQLKRSVAIAVTMLAGSYVLALMVATSMLYFAVCMPSWSFAIRLLLGVFAIKILWAIRPRIKQILAPGPELKPNEHARLFQIIKELCHRMGQAVPARVYLLPGMAVFAEQRGGLMGFGGRRILGIGLPLLLTLDVSQVKAMLTQELTRFHGSDIPLCSWILRVRAWVATAVVQERTRSGFIHRFLEWYGCAFLKVTENLSKNQETVAQRLATSVSGKTPLVEAKQIIESRKPIFQRYMQEVFNPVVYEGYLPPLSVGFQLYWSKTKPASGAENLTDSTTLLSSLTDLESDLVPHIFSKTKLPVLKAISWDDVGDLAYRSYFKKHAESYRKEVLSVFADAIPLSMAEMVKWESDNIGESEPDECDDSIAERTVEAIGALTIDHLAGNGWTLYGSPGEALTLMKGEHQVQPIKLLEDIAAGHSNPREWKKFCVQTGLSGVQLA